MKLNMDCVRDILLCIESNTSLHQKCYFLDVPQMESISDAIGDSSIPIPEYQRVLAKTYSNDVLFYHVRYCCRAGLVEYDKTSPTYQLVISDLSVSGHEFVNNIRDPKVWKDLKSAGSSVGSVGLDVLKQVAGVFVSALFKKSLRLS
jgi:hypothetical protein